VDIKKGSAGQRTRRSSTASGFHDLRRSFITRARGIGVAESVVMRMIGTARARCCGKKQSPADLCDRRGFGSCGGALFCYPVPRFGLGFD
jgi:hypothetical protein